MTLKPRLLQPLSCHLYTAMMGPTFGLDEACIIRCSQQQDT